jgi:hypothetical protein
MNSLVHLQKDDPPARYATSYLPCTRGLSESQPERRTSLRGYGHERSHREEFIEQWRVDPEVVATATPGTAIRDFVRSLEHDVGWCY